MKRLTRELRNMANNIMHYVPLIPTRLHFACFFPAQARVWVVPE